MSALMKWISVFRGPIWQVSMVQARLRDRGFQTYVPDPTLKVLDPFITGGGTALDAELQVPEDAAAAALQEVERISAERQLLAVDPGDDGAFGARGVRDLYRLGRRIQWAAWCGITAPIALILAPGYFRRVRQLGERPPAHGYVIAATVVAALIALQFFGVLAYAMLDL